MRRDKNRLCGSAGRLPVDLPAALPVDRPTDRPTDRPAVRKPTRRLPAEYAREPARGCKNGHLSQTALAKRKPTSPDQACNGVPRLITIPANGP